MATIHKMTELERRANDFALKKHPYSPFCEEYAKMYIEIATEQEKVDDAKIAGIIEFVHKNKEFMKPYGWFVEVSQLVEYVKSMYPDKDIAVLENGSFILRQKGE